MHIVFVVLVTQLSIPALFRMVQSLRYGFNFTFGQFPFDFDSSLAFFMIFGSLCLCVCVVSMYACMHACVHSRLDALPHSLSIAFVKYAKHFF